jgi:hypothetical protein
MYAYTQPVLGDVRSGEKRKMEAFLQFVIYTRPAVND